MWMVQCFQYLYLILQFFYKSRVGTSTYMNRFHGVRHVVAIVTIVAVRRTSVVVVVVGVEVTQ